MTQAATTGEVYPSLGTTVAESPWLDNDWTTPTNIYIDDAATANVTAATFDSPDQTFVLKATGFDFSAIPDGSTINGITVRLNSWFRSGVGSGSIDLCQLLDTSRAKVGTNNCATPVALTTTDTTIVTKGSASDLWGNTLTTEWIKDPDFGVAIGIAATAANADVDVDYVTIEVNYTPPPLDSDTAVEVHGAGAQANFNLNPLNDTAGEKFSALKFQISDKATTDALPTLIDQITIPISGTGANASTDIAWAELWDDTGGAQVAVASSITNSAIVFGATPNGGGTAGLDTINSAGTVRYTLNIYMKNSALTATDGQTYVFAVNDVNIGVDTLTTSSSQMRSNANAVSNVTGTTTVTHSKLIFSTEPPSTATKDVDFTGTITVSGTDANNNIDKDFTESITVSAVLSSNNATAGTGVLSSTDSGGLVKTATDGVVSWTDTKYSYAEEIDIKATSVSYSSGVYSSAVIVSGPTITVASSANQPLYVAVSTTNIVLGTASIISGNTSQVTAVTLQENSGTIAADTELANIQLWLSSDQVWDAGDNQLDTAKSFNGVDGEATFTETFSVTTTPQYLIIRGDIGSLADAGDTIEMQIKTVSTSDAVSGTPLNITGTSTVWNKRKQLVFNNSDQAENLTNFPVLVKLNSAKIDYSDVGNSDGTDLRFVDADHITELDYEIDEWNILGDSIVWVKVPQVDSSSATDSMWMYYGNAGVATGEDAENVWTNGYEAVYHFAETSSVYLDSTINNHDSDAQVLSARGTTTGSLGNAPSFSGAGNTHYITFPDSAGWDFTNLTIEAYIEPLGAGTGISTGNGGFGTGAIYPLVTKGLGEAESEIADVQFFMGLTVSPGYKVGSDYENWINNPPSASGNNPVSGATTLSTAGTWYYVAIKNSPAETTHKVYLNGASDNSTSTGALVPSKNGTQRVGIGVGVNTAGTRTGGFNGYIDEVRISNTGRSNAWIAAGQLSLSDTFITYSGSEPISISSAANQSFTVGDATTTISTITISDAFTPTITAVDDIRIKIPSSFNMTWDTSDFTATIGGGASSKASTTVSYPDARTLLIDVTTNFSSTDSISISGLSFLNFNATSSVDNLDLVTGGSGGSVVDTDSKTITIVGPTISSAVNQSFNVGDSASSSAGILITEGTGSITATNDIRIKIPANLNMTWDDTDTSIIIATTSPTLSTYVEDTFVADMPIITADLSGITYNPITDTIFGVTNGTPTIYEFSKTGTHLRTITMTGFIDTEGIEWMYGTTYAVTQERSPYDIITFTIASGTTAVDKTNDGTVITPNITFSSNLGMEGISYDPDNNWFYVAVEKPAAGGAVGVGGGRVFKVEMDGTSTEYTTLATNLLAAGNTDLADIVYDRVSGHLFLLSEENNMITEATTGGTIISSIATDARFSQPEGLEFSPDNNYMFVVSEPDDYQFLIRPTLASTTVSFEDSNKTMVINVLSDFLAASVLSISGMSFTNFSSASNADNLELEVLNNDRTQAYDDKTITITGGAQSLTFSISDNTIGFGTLSASGARYATGNTIGSTTEVEAHTFSASTNASGGYVIGVRGTTLTHTSNSSITIDPIGGVSTASTVGNEQFGLRATVTSGSGSVVSPYAASGFAYAGTATTTSQVASGNGDDASTIYSARYIGNINASTEAGSYSSTLTYIVTATF